MDISEVINKYYIPIIVQVGIKGRFVGTGFFVAPNTVLTCAHVLLKEDSKQIINDGMYLDNVNTEIKWNGTIYNGIIVSLEYSNPIGGVMTKDFALIRVDNILDHPIAVLDDEEIKHFDKCYAMGYPDGKPLGDSVTLEYEGITNESLLKFSDGQIQPGFSGSALLNTRTGKVCGIVKRTRDYTAPVGGWGIPISKIIETSPELSKLHRNNSVNSGWESCIGLQRKSKINIGMISSEYQPHIVGGLGVHVSQLTTALGKNANVDLILPEQSAGYVAPPTGVALNITCGTPIYTKSSTWLDFARQVEFEINHIHPDVIHCHDWCTVLAGIKYRWKYRKPLVFHIHLPNLGPLASPIESLGLVCADLVTVNSKAVRQEILGRDLPISRIEVIPNGVNTEHYKPTADWPVEEPYILFSGRLTKQKGVEFLLRAFFYVKEKFPDIVLKIAGEGDYKSYLQRLATNLMISDNVQFVGFKNEVELARLYQKAKVVIIPSINEPFGMVALEAMACGRPVVASRQGGLKEIIEEGKTGYFAEVGNYLDLAQAIMSLLADEKQRHQMGQNAYRYANNQKFQWSSIAQQYICYYNELTNMEPNRVMEENKQVKARKLINKIRTDAKQMDKSISDELLSNLFDWM